MNKEQQEEKIRTLCFLGSLVPPQQVKENIYCSPAANEFQMSLVKELTKKGFDHITSYSPTPYATFPKGRKIIMKRNEFVVDEKTIIVNTPYINLKLVKQMSIFFTIMYSLLRSVRERKPAVILSYNARPFYAFAALLLSRIARIEYFVIVADFEHHRYIDPLKHLLRFIEAIMTEFILRKSNGIICLSRLVPEDMDYKKPWIKMEGAIGNEWKGISNSDEEDTLNKKIIMYAGTLNEVGGVGLLLDAFQLIDGKDYQLWISGRGYQEKRVSELEMKDGRVTYLKYMDRKEYINKLSQATVLINPRLSKYPENRYNFPSKLLEYLASGTPVITTQTGDVEDSYGDKAFILRDETPQGLAMLLEEVLTMPQEELKNFGRRAREYMLSNMTWEAQANRINNFIIENAPEISL